MNLLSLELACDAVSVFSLSASILLVFPQLPTTLVSLKFTSLPYISPMFLKDISRQCKGLKELELSVVERLGIECCWACFEESSTCVKHSPTEINTSCDTAEELAVRKRPPVMRCIHSMPVDFLCPMPPTAGKLATSLHWYLPLLFDHPEGAYRQPFLSARGLQTHWLSV